MTQEERDFELTDSYINGKLSGSELDYVKHKIRNDKSFANQVALKSLLVKAIQKEREKELKTLLSTKPEVSYFSNMWPKKFMIPAAAIVLIAVGSYLALEFWPNSTIKPDYTIGNGSSVNNLPIDNKQNNLENNSNKENVENELFEIVEDTTSPILAANEVLDKKPASQEMTNDKDDASRVSKLQQPKNIAEERDEALLMDNVSASLDKKGDNGSSLIIKNIAVNISEISKEIVVEQIREKGLFKKKKEIEKEEFKTKPLGSTSVSLIEAKNEGYSYTNNKLSLYGSMGSSNIQLLKFGNRLYLKKNNSYYLIQNASVIKPLQKIGNTEIVNVLNQAKN